MVIGILVSFSGFSTEHEHHFLSKVNLAVVIKGKIAYAVVVKVSPFGVIFIYGQIS